MPIVRAKRKLSYPGIFGSYRILYTNSNVVNTCEEVVRCAQIDTQDK